MVLVQSLIFPTFLLIVYKLVIGESILKLTGDDSLYGLVPMCAVTGARSARWAPASPFPTNANRAC